MNIPKPKYEIGQRVMIRSHDRPEMNENDVIVVERSFHEYGICAFTDNVLDVHAWCYVTDSVRSGFLIDEEIIQPSYQPADDVFQAWLKSELNEGLEL